MGVVANDLNSKEFKSAYLLYGEEAYMRNYYKISLRNALVNEGDNLNYSYFEGNGTDVTEVTDLLQTMPFMAEHRVVIVENSGWFASKKSKEKEEDDEESSEDEGTGTKKLEPLIEMIKSLGEDVIIIFVEEKADKKTRLYKAIAAKGVCEEYARQTEEQLARWLSNYAKSQGKLMSPATGFYMVGECGNDMLLLKNEMDKLLAWSLDKDSITEADVDQVCSHQVNNKIFDMVTAITQHNQKVALKLYYDLLTLRESPFHILALVGRQYSRMIAVKDASLKNKPMAVVASELSMQEWLAKKTLDLVRRMSMEEIKANLEACVKADEDIKSGNLTDSMSVELLIIGCSERK